MLFHRFLNIVVFSLIVMLGSSVQESRAADQSPTKEERLAFAIELEHTIQENMPYQVFTDGPNNTRLVMWLQKGPGATPRPPTALEMDAKRLGFKEILYRTEQGNVTIKLGS